MKIIPFLLISLLFSTICRADITVESQFKKIVVERHDENEVQPDFFPDRQPASEGVEVEDEQAPLVLEKTKSSKKTMEKVSEDSDLSYHRVNLQFSGSLLKGDVYFGGKPTPAELNSYDLELLVLRKHYLYGAQLDYLNNSLNVKIYNLGVNAGLKQDWGRTQFLIYGGLGVSNYAETSKLQNINALGLSVTGTAAVNVFITHNLYVNVNYKYSHPMFTGSKSYWGSDPRSDIVFDVKGLGFGLGWSF